METDREAGTDEPRRRPIDLTRARAERDADRPLRQAPAVMPVVMAREIEPMIAALYRTEDIAVAPDGRRVVIPGFFSDIMVLADLDVVRHDGAAALHVSGASSVQCAQLRFPHGAAFIDERTVLVANRGAELMAIDVPPRDSTPAAVFRTGRVLVGEHDPVPVSAPSSLAVRTADGICEVLVCNNSSHTVTRYVLDIDDDLDVIDREVLIGDGLHTPDGVAISRSGQWLAISNHTSHEVFLYSYEPEAAVPARKVGTLRGSNYPHGVRFADDDRAIILNDAGLPYLYVYTTGDGDWSGVRDPSRTVRVMDDTTFNSARYNPQEGGPKGLAVLDDQRAIVSTSTSQRFACLSLDEVLDGLPGPPEEAAALGETGSRRQPDERDATLRDLVRRSLRRVQEAEEEAGRQQARVAEVERALTERTARETELTAEVDHLTAELTRLAAEVVSGEVTSDAQRDALEVLRAELDDTRRAADAATTRATAIEQSTAWRVTGPVRAVFDLARRPTRRS